MRQLKITRSITNRDNTTLDKYLQDIAREPMITPEEEVELAQRIRDDDQKALERMVNANLRFVVSVAKQYQNQGLSLLDLINEGNVGLIKAAKRFDETRGFKFISYAVWWIRQSISQAIAEQSRMIRLPLNQVGSLNKLKKTSSKLEQLFERQPSNSELAEQLEISETKLEAMVKANSRPISTDTPFTEDDEYTFLDFYVSETADPTDSGLMRESLSKEINRTLETLPEKEREIISLFFGIGMTHSLTLEEIGLKYNLSRERVRQIKENAMRRLKNTARTRALRSYLNQE
ncbi:MAG: RNA polymerase sigma factor RpoD/SigA [Lentimicrobiaceae bacterium]|jgi:RNA polymerase primary sigma factor|nr:RNA polymerase sigma factor RpoD/SigA [Lentimicrobiaceae bacterium]